jgi:hypothetical protein
MRRHREIEQNHVGRSVARRQYCAFGVAGDRYAVPRIAQEGRTKPLERRFVIHQQDMLRIPTKAATYSNLIAATLPT